MLHILIKSLIKIIDIFLKLVKKKNSDIVENCLKCIFNLLEIGKKFGIDGKNFLKINFQNNKNFENLIYLELRNDDILRLKNKIVDEYFYED